MDAIIVIAAPACHLDIDEMTAAVVFPPSKWNEKDICATPGLRYSIMHHSTDKPTRTYTHGTFVVSLAV